MRYKLILISSIACILSFKVNALARIPNHREIIDYTLYCYDNIIADYFENTTLYHNQLKLMLHIAIAIPKQDAQKLLDEINPSTQYSATTFLMSLNSAVKRNYNYVLFDD